MIRRIDTTVRALHASGQAYAWPALLEWAWMAIWSVVSWHAELSLGLVVASGGSDAGM